MPNAGSKYGQRKEKQEERGRGTEVGEKEMMKSTSGIYSLN